VTNASGADSAADFPWSVAHPAASNAMVATVVNFNKDILILLDLNGDRYNRKHDKQAM